MTRGMVKSKFICESKMGNPQPSSTLKLECTFCKLGQLMLDSIQTKVSYLK